MDPTKAELKEMIAGIETLISAQRLGWIRNPDFRPTYDAAIAANQTSLAKLYERNTAHQPGQG